VPEVQSIPPLDGGRRAVELGLLPSLPSERNARAREADESRSATPPERRDNPFDPRPSSRHSCPTSRIRIRRDRQPSQRRRAVRHPPSVARLDPPGLRGRPPRARHLPALHPTAVRACIASLIFVNRMTPGSIRPSGTKTGRVGEKDGAGFTVDPNENNMGRVGAPSSLRIVLESRTTSSINDAIAMNSG
jgi:hypothetical protein